METISPVVSGTARQQLTLDFTPGLTELYESALACVRARIYQQGKPLKTVAADMDMSQSELSRKLADNPDDPRHFTLHDLERYVRATGDTVPVQYLAQAYCANPAIKREEALSALAGLVPQLQALMKAVGASV